MVYNCLSGSGWSFLWSSIQICLLLLRVYLFLSWIFKTRIQAYHHGLEFSNMVFLGECCSEWIEVFFAFEPSSSPYNSFSMFTRLDFLLWSLYVPIFCSKTVLLSSHSVVGMSSHLVSLLAGGIFFRCFGMSCFVCIVWSFWSSFFRQYLLIHLFDVYLLFSLCCFCLPILAFFFFCLLSNFLICVSSPISYPGFEFLFVFSKGTPFFSQTNFAPA